VFLGACGSVVATADHDAGVTEAGTLGSPEASDGAVDVTKSSQLCPVCIDPAVAWEWNGGRQAFSESSLLSTCATYTHSRSPLREDGGTQQCSEELVCSDAGDAGPADIDSVVSAVGHPDVQAAFAASTPHYGGDPRPCDGGLMRIRLGAKSIDVGPECGQGCLPQPTCVPVPAGLRRLAEVLAAVDQHERRRPACSGLQ
jgi:hypothetical protein